MNRPPFPPADDDSLGGWIRRSLHELPDAPAPWIESALALMPLQAAAGTAPAARRPLPAEPLLQRVLALLRFDSFGPQLAPALRGAGSATRQLLFHAEGRDIDIDLRLPPPDARGRCTLRGQVLGPELDAAEVLLQPAGAGAAPADGRASSEPSGGAAGDGPSALPAPGAGPWARPLDELGEFHFDGLDPGEYRLSLRLASALVELPPLQLGTVRPASPA